jgi:hypothetical protein
MAALCIGKPAGHPSAVQPAGLSIPLFQPVETDGGDALSITSRYELSDATTRHYKPQSKTREDEESPERTRRWPLRRSLGCQAPMPALQV